MTGMSIPSCMNGRVSGIGHFWAYRIENKEPISTGPWDESRVVMIDIEIKHGNRHGCRYPALRTSLMKASFLLNVFCMIYNRPCWGPRETGAGRWVWIGLSWRTGTGRRVEGGTSQDRRRRNLNFDPSSISVSKTHVTVTSIAMLPHFCSEAASLLCFTESS